MNARNVRLVGALLCVAAAIGQVLFGITELGQHAVHCLLVDFPSHFARPELRGHHIVHHRRQDPHGHEIGLVCGVSSGTRLAGPEPFHNAELLSREQDLSALFIHVP